MNGSRACVCFGLGLPRASGWDLSFWFLDKEGLALLVMIGRLDLCGRNVQGTTWMRMWMGGRRVGRVGSTVARACVVFRGIRRVYGRDDGDRGDDDWGDDDWGGGGETRDVDGGDWHRWVRARASWVWSWTSRGASDDDDDDDVCVVVVGGWEDGDRGRWWRRWSRRRVAFGQERV